MSRPLVSVFDPSNSDTGVAQATLPAVMTAPIRPDIVNYVHNLMSKNKRQAYAVARLAGMETPAVSWGTGRAVSRIPRVPGGGTSRSGQGAFGNMCRGGRMFAPNKVWRRWHRKINVNQRRYAVASALAASALPSLVMARGHRVDMVPEFPLVIDDSVNKCSRTKDAKALLERFGAYADVEKCADSKKLKRGVGKSRNRRYSMRRGPLVIYATSEGIDKGFRNLSGVEVTSVDNLNLLDLAPGGHLGRFCIWTKGAFEKLDSLFGTYEKGADLKTGYNLPHGAMTNADLARIINSDEVQSVCKAAVRDVASIPQKRNPLKNKDVMLKLNPFADAAKARAAAKEKKNSDSRKKEMTARRAFKTRRKAFKNAAAKEGEVTF
jgi:large subunit ribosomal protein L4e